LTSTLQPETTSNDRRANLSILALTAFLRGAHTSVYNVIWQPFVLSLGASMPAVGLLNSVGGNAGLIPTLVQPLGGWLADRLGRKPFIILASIAFIACYALFWLSGALNIWVLLLLGVVALGVTALALPARNSMTAESVRERHGSAFSAIMVATMLPGILVPPFAGVLADRLGYISVFPLAAALEALALFLVWRYMRETRLSDGGGIRWRDTSRVMLRSIVPPPGLGGFFSAVAADSFFWSVGWGLLYGMISDTYHFSAEQLGIMSGVMSLAWAIVQMPIGRYIDRHDIKLLMIFSEGVGIPLMMIWITQTRFEIFAASHILMALTAATWVPTVSTYLTRKVGPAERAEAFGRLYLFRGVVAFPSSTIGGLLYAWGGLRVPLVVNLLGILVIMAILALFVHEPERNQEVVL